MCSHTSNAEALYVREHAFIKVGLRAVIPLITYAAEYRIYTSPWQRVMPIIERSKETKSFSKTVVFEAEVDETSHRQYTIPTCRRCIFPHTVAVIPCFSIFFASCLLFLCLLRL
jgi:hypothetical protein